MNSVKQTTQKPVQERNYEEQVACEICLAEVPLSEAKSEEASDYVAHFCGLDCYDKWRKSHEEES